MTDSQALSGEAQRAVDFAEGWVAAWNDHDLERVMGHYSPDVAFTSPLITTRPDRTVRTASELRSYFGSALAANPGLEFELLGAFAGVDSVTVVYRTHRGWVGAETMTTDPSGVIHGAAHYGQLTRR